MNLLVLSDRIHKVRTSDSVDRNILTVHTIVLTMQSAVKLRNKPPELLSTPPLSVYCRTLLCRQVVTVYLRDVNKWVCEFFLVKSTGCLH